MKDTTSFKLVDASNKSNSRTLLVYVPGILANGTQSSLLVIDNWRRYGDVLIVSCDGGRFKPDESVADIKAWLLKHADNYDTVVFIGVSKGGLVSYDTALELGDQFQDVRFVIEASPSDTEYFKSPADKASIVPRLWFAGPVSNLTTGKLFLKLLFQKPKAKNVEAGVNTDELKQRVKEAQASKISVYTDEIRYMNNHGLVSGSLSGHKGVYILNKRDDIVSPEAYEPWNSAFGGSLLLLESDTTHAGFNEMPEAFNQDFDAAFEMIGLSAA